MIHDKNKLEREMHDLLVSGLSLGDAIRTLFVKGYGKLLLCDPVMNLGNIDSKEAKRIVIRETAE